MLRRVVVALLLVGPVALPAQRGPATAPVVSTITYTDWAISAPATLPAGYLTFRAVNRGRELHHATLIRFDDGKTLKDFLEAIRKPVAPAWAVTMGGLQNSGQVTIELKPGNYAWWCFMPGPDGVSHSAKGMWKGFTVTAPAAKTMPPAFDITVTMRGAGKAAAWMVDKPLTVGRHTLRISNEAGPPHEFMLVRLVPGKNTNDFLGWIDKQSGPAPFVSIEGVPTMQSGSVNFATVDFRAGRYSILSFAPDASDGKPQFTHGMVREIVLK